MSFFKIFGDRVGRGLALYTIDPDLNPSIPYGLTSLSEDIFEHRARISTEHFQAW